MSYDGTNRSGGTRILGKKIMLTIELDIALDTDEPAYTDLFVINTGVELIRDAGALIETMEVVTLHGPAGGAPVLRFVAPRDELIKLVAAWDPYENRPADVVDEWAH